MEMRSSKGATLIELVIYFALSSLVALTIVSAFRIATATQQATYSSYLMSGRTYSGVTVLRRDLQNTALSAITAYPNASDSSEAPGMSCPSPFGFEGERQGELHVNPYGSPEWKKMVHYTVKKKGNHVGTLLRWSKKIDSKDLLPLKGTLSPSQVEGDQGRGLLEDVLLGNQTVDGVGENGQFQTGPSGGFEVQFVRREGGEDGPESLSTENPSTQEASGNTRLVEVTLRILRDEKRSQPTLYVLKVRACPRY
jgi:hypothetical protein